MKTKYTKADRRPTWTSLVLALLVRADDFLSMQQIAGVVGGSPSQVGAALSHLRKFGAADSVVGGDGALWWFATPADDKRSRTVERRAEEPKGNRTRRPVAKKTD